MKKLKRFTAMLLTVLLLIPCAAAMPAQGAFYPGSELLWYAESIADAARNFQTTYDLGDGLTTDELRTVMTIVLNENPDFFHLSGAYKYTYDPKKPNIALDVLLYYNMTPGEYAAAKAEVNTWIAKVVSLTDPDFTDFEYALFFHDYIASNYDYDTAYQVRDVYSFIKEGVGVCQAYTYMYMMLLDEVGIGNSYASSDEMNHIWNLVELDGHWYHVDVTWDDPVGGTPGEARHDFFLLSDTAIYYNENRHHGWISLYDCDSTKYDSSSVNQAETSYAYLDGKWYYLKDGDLYSTSSPELEGAEHMSLDLRWYAWQSSSYYLGTYSGMIARGGKLYVNTPDKVIRIDPAKKTSTDVFGYTHGDGYIYGFTLDMGEDGVAGAAMDSGNVILNISTNPNIYGKKAKISLDSGKFVVDPGSGDANEDGRVNLADVSLTLKYIAKWNVTLSTVAADMDTDTRVNLSDVTAIMKKIAGWAL